MVNMTNTTIIFPDFLYKYGTIAKQQAFKHITTNISLEAVIILSVVFTIYYLGFQNTKFYKSRNFYKNLYADKYNDCLKLEDDIAFLRRKVKLLETRLNMKRRELESGILITDIDRESMLDDFTTIVKSLPVDAEETFTLIQKLANKFDISITVESGNKKRKNTRLPTRRQPKRMAAPVKFLFEEDDEDDKRMDPDYKI